jgi:RNA polymerase sigma-70 factor (ECF subfamily)
MDFDSTPFDSAPDARDLVTTRFDDAAGRPRRGRKRRSRSSGPSRSGRPVRSREADLVERLRRGDDAAYRELVETQRERMLAVARRFLPEEEDARDAVQEAFIAAFRSIDRFEGNAALSTWLHRVVVNACLMKLRSRRRRPESPLTPEMATTLAPLIQRDATVEVDEQEIVANVRAAVDALPEPHRSVLRLRDLEERDTREAAKALVISQAAVKTRLHRARKLLRSRIGSDPDLVAHFA